MGLAGAEDIGDDVIGRVAHVTHVLHDLKGLVNVALYAVVQHRLDQLGVGLITHLGGGGGTRN